jgi:transmembrane 9 superfamily protein 3
MPFYLKRRIVMPLGGLIIFGSIFFEVTYVWDSMWGNRLYAMFGSLLLVMVLLCFVVGELSVVHTYLLL